MFGILKSFGNLHQKIQQIQDRKIWKASCSRGGLSYPLGLKNTNQNTTPFHFNPHPLQIGPCGGRKRGGGNQKTAVKFVTNPLKSSGFLFCSRTLFGSHDYWSCSQRVKSKSQMGSQMTQVQTEGAQQAKKPTAHTKEENVEANTTSASAIQTS